MKSKNIVFFVAIAVICIGTVVSFIVVNNKKHDSKNLKKVKVQAGWLLNGEFSNVCSAIVNGYYQDQGLDVEMVPGGPAGASFTVATDAVAQNPDLTLGIDGDLVPLVRGVTKENEAERLKVKAFASFWNENPYGFIVRTDSGITSIKDLATKRKKDGSKYKIGLTADAVVQGAIAKYAEINEKDLDIVTVGFDATPFLTGQVDALAGYWTTQAYEVDKAGIDYKFLSASELPGFNQPSMIAVASEKTLKEQPELLVSWLRGTIKGMDFVKNNPDKAAEQILDNRCGGPKFDKDQEAWLIKKSIPLFDKDNPGNLSEDQVMGFAEAYKNLGQIPRVPGKEELMDFSILNKI